MTKRLFESAKLREAKGAPKGVFDVTLISAGQGSSGYYSAEMLESNAGVFKAGTPSFFNHLDEGQEAHERDVTKLAGKLTEDAHYDEDLQALVAPVQFRKEYIEFIEDFKDTIGMSISAAGTGSEGEVDGNKTFVVESFEEHPYNSVDVVVAAGRGGKVNRMLESAKVLDEATNNDRSRELSVLVRKRADSNDYAYVEDFDDANVWYTTSDGTFQQSYSTISDVANELVGDPTKVVAKTSYVAIENSRTTGAEAESKGLHMDKDVTEAFEGVKETLRVLAERLPEPAAAPEATEVDIASVVESAVEAGLSKTARARVVEAVRGGTKPDEAIAAEKALRDEYESEFKARESAEDAGNYKGTEAKTTTASDLAWLKK